MTKRQTEQVRDDNLRLLLSTQEAGFIRDRLHDARMGIRVNAIVGGIALLYCVWFAGTLDNAVWIGVPEAMNSFTGIAAVVAAVIGVYGLIRIIGAGLSLLRFKSYEADHEKFLMRYRR